MLSRPTRYLAPVSLLALAACNGGDGGGSVVVPPGTPGFLDPAGTGTVNVTAVSLDSGARSTDTLTGTIDQDADTFAVGSLTGRIDPARTGVVLTNGGAVDLTPGPGDSAYFYVATPTTGNRTLGIVGLPTAQADVPTTGNVTYTGTADVTIQEGATVYELTGAGTVAADFGAGNVTTTVSGLTGTQTSGLTAPVAVTNAGTVEFTGSAISGTTFSGGTPTLVSPTISGLSSQVQSDLDGAFYGPDAAEAGAVFVIDDSADGSVTAFGRVLSRQ